MEQNNMCQMRKKHNTRIHTQSRHSKKEMNQMAHEITLPPLSEIEWQEIHDIEMETGLKPCEETYEEYLKKYEAKPTKCLFG